MNKTATTELHRLFLIEKLPEPLTPSSSHLQLFDNYIENTRLRLRSIRDPYSNSWTHTFQQRMFLHEDDLAVAKLAEIHLNEAEHSLLSRFEGREIRKNRYFHEFDLREMIFDVYLGDQLGLSTVRVDFVDAEDMKLFEKPPFAIYEVTNEQFFYGEKLVSMTFDQIREELAKLENRQTAA